MNNLPSVPSLADLSRLGQQIEKDRSIPVRVLRQRDHAIGIKCHAKDDVNRLLFWLNNLPQGKGTRIDANRRMLSEISATHMIRIFVFCLGFLSMSGFVLSKDDLINISVFFLVFVLIQVVLWVISMFVMVMSWLGNSPVVFPLNVAKYVVNRSLPDVRYMQESKSVIRALLLRYGQEFGALFTLGSVLGFFIVILPISYGFKLESTYRFSETSIQHITSLLATPWSSLWPEATPSVEAIQASRSMPVKSKEEFEISKGWWPFLIMSIVFYALLPRIILWITSKQMYVQLMRRSFVNYPGSDGVLLRMKSPLVSTQSYESENHDSGVDAVIPLDEGLLLLSWANAVDVQGMRQYEEIRMVPQHNVLSAGLDNLAEDRICVDRINEYKPSRLLVAVKSWEPPMAELRDLLDSLTEVTRCTVCLVPLPGHSVPDLHLQEWRDFSRNLLFKVVDTRPLTRL